MTGRTFVDDNFGVYDMSDPESEAFYHRVQRESVWKRCNGCGRRVKLRPDYGICNSCCEVLERGGDLG
jgi:hypothetical protein